MPQPDPASGPLARFVAFFLRGNLPPFLALLWLLGGLLSVVLTPREEDPQIVVPMADVHVLAPGLSVQEVERQVATRLEKLMAQIQGVEHVYSMSLPGRAVVTVRFHVGENREDSLVEVYNKLLSNTDRIPPGVESWVVKPVEIDDVPIVVASLWSERPEQVDDFLLRRIAEEIEIELQALPDTNRTEVVGGRPRVVRVELDPDALAARRTSALDVAWALQVSNLRRPAGRFDRLDRSFEVETGEVFGGIDALRRAVVNVVDGLPVLLQDVARIADGPAEAEDYSWIGFGPAEAGAPSPAQLYPAVHVAVAKQRGTNAVTVAERVVRRLDELARTHLPDGVQVRITRNYGRTADEKVSSLLESLAAALVIVVALLAWALGWREALVVAVAVPLSFSLSLLINYAAGYTINRVTLFALILSLGLVVDDSIVDVENVYRHLRLRAEEPLAAVLRAVNEVRLPMLLATLAVIVAFLPMLFITGMMGPYMRPMALNVPVAMLMSALVELTVTPWVAHRALRRRARAAPGAPEAAPVEAGVLYRAYARVVRPFLGNRRRAWRLLGATALLFVGAASLAALRAVPLKMLPFDNKDELQVIVNAPEGTTLERTDAVTRALAAVLAREPDVLDFELFTGLASPMDFNGMVRHYFLRRGPELADIRVNLAPKAERSLQSHAIALRLRDPAAGTPGAGDAHRGGARRGGRAPRAAAGGGSPRGAEAARGAGGFRRRLQRRGRSDAAGVLHRPREGGALGRGGGGRRAHPRPGTARARCVAAAPAGGGEPPPDPPAAAPRGALGRRGPGGGDGTGTARHREGARARRRARRADPRGAARRARLLPGAGARAAHLPQGPGARGLGVCRAGGACAGRGGRGRGRRPRRSRAGAGGRATAPHAGQALLSVQRRGSALGASGRHLRGLARRG
jgi:multidrug efflux pump subunit AcrB